MRVKQLSFIKFNYLLAILALPLSNFAQTDSTISSRDTSFTPVKTAVKIPAKGFNAYIFPTALIGYGALSLFASPLKNLNYSIKHQIVTNHPNFSTHIDNYLWTIPTVALYGLNVVGIEGKHDFRDRTVIVLISNTIMEASTFITKRSVHELRPNGSNYESFPSGHTASAFTAAEYLYQEYKDVSPWIGISGYAVAGATGVLRLYSNEHYFSDVIAGAGFGILSTKIAYTIYPFVMRHLFKNYSFKTVAIPAITQGTVGFNMVHHFY